MGGDRPDGRYKLEGEVTGQFWYVVGMWRFEPGELDAYLPGIGQIPLDAEFSPPGILPPPGAPIAVQASDNHSGVDTARLPITIQTSDSRSGGPAVIRSRGRPAQGVARAVSSAQTSSA